MAIYSCNLKSVGRKTHAAGTAGAHLRYIARDGADATIDAHHMPSDPEVAKVWMDEQENADRANARVISKIVVALPVELSEQERYELARAYVREITQDRVSWFFAIHQSGKDAHNPHAHIVIRDRDPETGKRVLLLSDSASDRRKAGLPECGAEWVRERWEVICNQHLERAGHEARIDRRSLKEQGIDREPTIHIGPAAQRVEDFNERPQSKEQEERTWRKRYRSTAPYPTIDLGRTRKERHAEIVAFNREKAAALKYSNDNLTEGNFMNRNAHHYAALKEEELNAMLRQQPEDEQDRLDELEAREKELHAVKADQAGKNDKKPAALDEQQKDESAALSDLAQQEKRIGAFKTEQARQAEEAKKQEKHKEEEKTRDGDITNAQYRYGQALGQHYDMRDPYGSLARASMAEYGAFMKQRQALDWQIANAKDPEERKALKLRRDIEEADYMAITDTRIATIGEVSAGKETNDVKQRRERAVMFQEKAAKLRQEYRTVQQERAEKAESLTPEQKEKERVKNRQQEWKDTRAKEQAKRDNPTPDLER